MIQSREHMGYRDEYTSNNNQPDVMKADFFWGGSANMNVGSLMCGHI